MVLLMRGMHTLFQLLSRRWQSHVAVPQIAKTIHLPLSPMFCRRIVANEGHAVRCGGCVHGNQARHTMTPRNDACTKGSNHTPATLCMRFQLFLAQTEWEPGL